MLKKVKFNLGTALKVSSLVSIFGAAAFIGIVSSSPAQARKCITNPITGKKVCSLKDLDPTTGIPGSKEVSEQLWGEAGAVAYPAAAKTMRARHGSSQGLDEFQKRNLRPHFGDLVDRVVVIYSARMMDQWNAFGKSINLSGVDTAAQTYCNRIYVRDSYKPNDSPQLVLLSHEMTHSRQCEQLGGEGKFGFHYFREYKRGGQSYEGNKFEKEASNFEGQFTPSTAPSAAPNTGAQLPSGTDLGYANLPRAFVDVNGDGLADYCRFVGDAPNVFIACMLRTSGGGWGEQFDYQSIKGIDQGYSDQPRGFKDINGDGKADYCRFVGDAPNIIESCNLAEPNRFSTDQFHNF